MLIKPPSRTDLHAAYEAAGCPVCGMLKRSERRYIDATLYEHVTDVRWRAEVRAARGFCTLHTRDVLEVGRSALGVSLVAGDILKTLRESLTATSSSGGALGRLRAAIGGGSGLAAALQPQQPCPICTYLADLGAVYVVALLDDLTTDEGRAAYERSVGLCLPHLLAAARCGGPGLSPLVDQQARVWERLEGELSEFARKSDYRFSDETIEAERDAWRRALLLLSGE
ncbi:MAG: hypothetical protein JOZ51_05910 [Chloroflexi bacterium]|nr:hypothetical protein [Chloroflexota bacterium]